VTTTTIKSGKSKRAGKRSKAPKGKGNLTDVIIAAQMYPELVGPVKLPIVGSNIRSTLGMDRARTQQIGSTTNVVQACTLSSLMMGSSVGSVYGTTTENAVMGSATGVAPGVQFPGSTSVADGRMTSGCITVSYTGNVLNCGGEVILGVYPSNQSFSGTTYSQLAFLPGTIRLPIASLVETPLRVSMRHGSPVAWDLIPYNSNVTDIDQPFIASSGLPNGQALQIEITRNFEIRSVVGVNEIPYASSSMGRASDDAAFTNAFDYLSKLPNLVSSVRPDSSTVAGRIVDRMFNSALQYVTDAGTLAFTNAAGAHLQRLRTGGRNLQVHEL
jgi:hypothetical protein